MSGLARFSALLLLLLALVAPSAARAQTPPATYSCGTDNTNTIDQQIQSGFSGAQTERMNAHSAYVLNYGNNVIGQCWTKIQNLFQLLPGIGLGPGAAIFNLILNQIMSELAQLCNFALNTMTQASTFVTSEISSLTCLPLPHLGLTLNNLQFPHPTCNGLPLHAASPVGIRPAYIYQMLLQQSSGGAVLQ
jgi:hypothetical protein